MDFYVFFTKRFILPFTILRLLFCLRCKMEMQTVYRNAIKALDWGDARSLDGTEEVFVVGHKSPDSDSVMAALSYARLMRALGYNAVPKMAGKANNETVFVAKEFGIELPEILDSASACDLSTRSSVLGRLILVDHSDYAQAVDGARDASILQVIDHHGIGDIVESKLLYAKYMPVGSTCSIVYTSYKELGVEITPDVAKILFAGLLADTLNLVKVTVTDVDCAIFEDLLKILAGEWNLDLETARAKVNQIFEGMVNAAHDFSSMTDDEIFNSDAKDYLIGGAKFRLGSLDWKDISTIDEFADRMLSVMPKVAVASGNNMVFCRVGFGEASYILYGGADAVSLRFAKAVAENAFGKSRREGIIYCGRRLSRKLDVVPMLTEALG